MPVTGGVSSRVTMSFALCTRNIGLFPAQENNGYDVPENSGPHSPSSSSCNFQSGTSVTCQERHFRGNMKQQAMFHYQKYMQYASGIFYLPHPKTYRPKGIVEISHQGG